GPPGSTSTACAWPRSATTSSAATSRADEGAPGGAEPGALERRPVGVHQPREIDRAGGHLGGGRQRGCVGSYGKPSREFDLNIERGLENWTIAHAIRELIANALDEAALTGTAEP